jgi:hypothetical protein
MPESSVSDYRAEMAGQAWKRRKSRPEDVHLLGHTDNWLNSLPKGVRPLRLQHEFPRIANDLAQLWADASALERYFEEKQFSPRRDRRGFPPLIKEELWAMHVYTLQDRPVHTR